MSDPIIKRGRLRSVVGLEVDELNLTMYCNSDTVVGNVPMTQFSRQGGFDGARLTVTRQFSAGHGQTACGSLNLFSGRVGPLTISGSEIAMSVKCDLELLDIQMPRNLFMGQCIHTLYDSGCGLSAAAFTVTGAVQSGSSTGEVTSNLAQPADYFALGVIKFTSGDNNQVQRSISGYAANGAISVMPPLNVAPAPGDTFTIRPGCDKLKATCDARFSNGTNFRGYPFIPVPEASY